MKKKDWIIITVIALSLIIFGNLLPARNWTDQEMQIKTLQQKVGEQDAEIGRLQQFRSSVNMVLDLKEYGDCCAVSERLDSMSGGGIFKYWEAKEKANQ